jgi:anti-sigma B factor antagonist
MQGTLLTVVVTHGADRDVVSPTGDIDIASAPALRDALRATTGRRRLVLDLRGVEFMDTSGLQIVVEEQKRAADRGGPFTVVRGRQRIQRLLDIAGLTPKLDLVDAP